MEIAKGILPASKPQHQQREVYVIHVQRHTDSQQNIHALLINKLRKTERCLCNLTRTPRSSPQHRAETHLKWKRMTGLTEHLSRVQTKQHGNVCGDSDWPGETRRVVFDLMSARRICFTFKTMETKNMCGSWKSLSAHVTCSVKDIV